MNIDDEAHNFFSVRNTLTNWNGIGQTMQFKLNCNFDIESIQLHIIKQRTKYPHQWSNQQNLFFFLFEWGLVKPIIFLFSSVDSKVEKKVNINVQWSSLNMNLFWLKLMCRMLQSSIQACFYSISHVRMLKSWHLLCEILLRLSNKYAHDESFSNR